MQLKHAIMKYFSFILLCLFSYNTGYSVNVPKK